MNHEDCKQQPFLLIVDDIAKNLQVLGNILSAKGYHYTPAMNGSQALKIIEKRPPDLILLDIMMPDMDGFEVCEKLKSSPETSDIPVIFLSAKTETEDIIKGFELGAVDYVTKPFCKQELLARIETHLDLKFARQKLQELNATKDKFFSIISHDLRSPFNAFIGLTELMIDSLADFSKDEIKEMLVLQYENANRFFALLENLLTWSRIQRNLIECVPESLCVHDIIQNTISLFQSNAQQKQISLYNFTTKDTLVYADRNIINTIMRNLISNALKFTNSLGIIKVSESCIIADQDNKSYVEICVSDSGKGMDAKTLSGLFRIDVKHSEPGTAGEKGSGLGLILCKELIEKNQGRIYVESEPGKGTSFKFTLPAMDCRQDFYLKTKEQPDE
ncbi:Two component system response regulator histidine kinase [Desulfonema limicola]|uniref:histidine kinase n=1 Tax=Desulfonema limicola TaxID=45656 RepID=A0A975GHK1_9BACT|nr:hybrid sensor histidine kinase/response regulator [Desulfonema limicola]QTA81389.1 Two component system response regulator histidine kinase [Desulfonema limicola]